MNKTELKNKINELEKQLSELKEELNKPENKVFKPEIGCRYYYIDELGDIYDAVVFADLNDVCELRYEIGNYFKTEEEAKFEVERLKVIAELKRFAKEHNEPIDWKNPDYKPKWNIFYDYHRKIVSVDYWYATKHNDIYFSSKEIVRQAIETVGEERIKKYYLMVE